MAKIIELNKNNNRPELDGLRKIEESSARLNLEIKKREDVRKDDIHKLDVRDRNLKYFKNLTFTIFFVLVCLIQFKDYIFDNISISREAAVGIAFISCLNVSPKNILTYFKKPPP